MQALLLRATSREESAPWPGGAGHTQYHDSARAPHESLHRDHEEVAGEHRNVAGNESRGEGTGSKQMERRERNRGKSNGRTAGRGRVEALEGLHKGSGLAPDALTQGTYHPHPRAVRTGASTGKGR